MTTAREYRRWLHEIAQQLRLAPDDNDFLTYTKVIDVLAAIQRNASRDMPAMTNLVPVPRNVLEAMSEFLQWGKARVDPYHLSGSIEELLAAPVEPLTVKDPYRPQSTADV